MRKIKLKKWKVKNPPDGSISEETLLTAIDTLITISEIPKGLKNFIIFSALGKAYDNAVKTGTLVLEEREYEFLNELITKNIPARWGLNKNLRNAIKEFLEAEEES